MKCMDRVDESPADSRETIFTVTGTEWSRDRDIINSTSELGIDEGIQISSNLLRTDFESVRRKFRQ